MAKDLILNNDGIQFADGSTQYYAVGRNKIINGNFNINQRVYVSGAAVGTNLYGHDRWKMAGSADTYTFATVANITTITIPATKVLRQVVEGLNLESGTYCLSWVGTAQGKIGSGGYAASGITAAITGGTNTTIEFGPGTVSKVQLERSVTASSFEFRDFGAELNLCQRYYEKSYSYATAPGTNVAGTYIGATLSPTVDAGGSVYVGGTVALKVEKRSVPTLISYWDLAGGQSFVTTLTGGGLSPTHGALGLNAVYPGTGSLGYTVLPGASNLAAFCWQVGCEL